MSGQEEEDLSYNQMDSEDMHNSNMSEEVKKSQYVVPTSKNKLRACTHCRLIKSDEQWKNSRSCQNCGDITSLESYTTDKFTGITSIVNDTRSWVRRKNKFTKKDLVLGAYALSLN